MGSISGFFKTYDRQYLDHSLTTKMWALRNIITFFGDKAGLTDDVLKINYNLVSTRNADEAIRSISGSRNPNQVSLICVGKTNAETFKQVTDSLMRDESVSRLEGAERYFQSAGYMAAVGTSEGGKYTTLVIGDTNPIYLNDKTYVEIGVILPSCMPWLTKDKPGEEYLALARAISVGDYDSAIAMMEKNHEDQAGKEALKLLEASMSNRYRKRIEQTDRLISDVMERIKQYERSIREQYQRMEQYTLEREGMLATGINKKIFAEVIDYMQKADMTLLGMNGDKVFLRINGYLTNFDEEMAKKMIGNISGVLYETFPDGVKKTAQKIFNSIFISNEYKIRVYAEVCINLATGQPDRYGDSPWIRNERIYNPHILAFNCFGQTTSVTSEAASTGNFMGLFMQMKAQVQNLNFGDGAVVPKLSRVIYENPTEKVFESTETGELVSFTDLEKIFKEKGD